MKLRDSLERQIGKRRRYATGAYYAAHLSIVATVVTSVMAGIAAGWAPPLPHHLLAILCAAPAAILTLSKQMNWEERSSWHYEMLYKLEQLAYELDYENATAGAISDQWRKLNDYLQPRWHAFGKPTESSEKELTAAKKSGESPTTS